jgi:hypothetical protein
MDDPGCARIADKLCGPLPGIARREYRTPAKSSDGRWTSQPIQIKRFGSALRSRFAHKLLEFRPRPGIIKQSLPFFVILPREEEASKIGYFGSLILGQRFANADEFLGFGAHKG